MKRITTYRRSLVLTWLALFIALPSSWAGVLFPEPPGGWTYRFDGDKREPGSGTDFDALDGTWSHNNGSDQWDGSEIGGTFASGGYLAGNAPGGASVVTEKGVTFLRIQDPGDPRDYSFSDPSNRKVYLVHSMTADGATESQMQDGLTLSFRARIPTPSKATGPLDGWYRDGLQTGGVLPFPAGGDGYVTSDGGKGHFVIHEVAGDPSLGGAIAFSLTQTNDTTGGALTPVANFAGLTMNEFNGNKVNNNVNFGQGSATNLIALDPTDWHEFWIVLRKDPANVGTHVAFIYVDGSLTPSVFKLTAGGSNGSADGTDTYLAMGSTATPQNTALDVDFVAFKLGEIHPGGALDNLPPETKNVKPEMRTPFFASANGITLDATTQGTNSLPSDRVRLTLNGQDVSGGVTVSGAAQARAISYRALQPNTVYSGEMIVADQAGRSATNALYFDTFVEAQSMVIEAEDYNFNGGQFTDNAAPGSYSGSVGTASVDYYDTTPASLGTYRASDTVDTEASADVARSNFTAAGATDAEIGLIGATEWCNYTRTFTAGTYRVFLRAGSTAVQDVRFDRILAGASQTEQSKQLLGTFRVPRTGSVGQFENVALSDYQGQPLTLSLSGKETLRLTAVGAADDLALNYVAFVPGAATGSGDPVVVAQPGAGASGVMPGGVLEIAVIDGTTPVQPAMVKLKLDGGDVTPVVEKNGSVTQVRYTPPTFLTPRSTHRLAVSFNDGTPRSFEWSFTMADYQLLTAAMKAQNVKTAGFVWRMFQNEAVQDTTTQRTEDALAGRLKGADGQPLPNLSDPTVTGPASSVGSPSNPGNGLVTFRIPTVINVGQAAESAFGSFTPDEQMPGVPGTSGSNDGIAVEVLTFLELPAGLITMGINSDDGFRVTAGYLSDTPLVLGELNGGRSAADTIFQFAVAEAGVYPFRTTYEEGNGNASLEWFTVKADGSKVLVNDTANGGVKAYQEGVIPAAPPAAVTLSVRVTSDGKLTLEWAAGTLQSAGSVGGPYQDVAASKSPFSFVPDQAQRFYRIRL